MSLLLGAAPAHLRRPRDLAARQFVPDRRRAPPRETFLPAARVRLRAVLPRPARGDRGPEQIFSDYALLLLLSRTSWCGTRSAYAEATIPARPRRREPGRRDREQRRLPAAVLRAGGVPVLGIEPAANVAEVGREKGSRRSSSSSASETAQRLAAEGRQADLIVGNNVLAHVPDAQRLRRGHAILLAARRRDHDGVPAPAAADRGQRSSTRSTTSTSRTSRS